MKKLWGFAGWLLASLLLGVLRLYKAVVSPLLPPACRFHPSCSVYAMGAIAVHGPFRGGLMALRRLARCHPFHAGGLDPVPSKDGQSADAILRERQPALARWLEQAPPPHLAAFLPPPSE